MRRRKEKEGGKLKGKEIDRKEAEKGEKARREWVKKDY